MTLKKSEKILLQILIVFAVIAMLVVFLLLPKLAEKQVLTEENETLQIMYQNRQELMNNQTIDQYYEDARNLAKQNYDYFYAVLNSYTIDGIVNKIAQSRQLSIQSLTIGNYEDASADFEEQTGQKLEVLVRSEISLSVKGSYSSILKFMDDMNEKSPCLRISMASIAENGSDATGEEQMTATLKIYIYGIDVELPELQ